MRLPQGYAVIVDPDARRMTTELDTFTCSHCNRVVHVRPLTDPADMGGRCLNCEDGKGRGLICQACVGKPCAPFMRRIEEEERRAALYQALACS